jgi:hypothetical protein
MPPYILLRGWMAANSWNPNSFVFSSSSLFFSSFRGLAWELHVRSRERDGWLGGNLDCVWTFMVCIDDSAWFHKLFYCLSRSPFCWFSELFVVIFVVEFWGWFLVRFLLGVTYEDLVPLWLVILLQESPWIRLDLVVFWVTRVLALESRNPRFLLIVSDSGRFFWGRGCPGGIPAIPEVLLQSVEWFGRSGDGNLKFDPRLDFLEGAV